MNDTCFIDLDALAAAVAKHVAAELRTEAEKLLDLPALAARLALSERGVRGLVQRDELPQGYLIGGVRRWSWAHVEKFLDARADRKPRRKRRGQYDRAAVGAAEGETD